MEIQHRPGTQHKNVDALSRLSCRQCREKEIKATLSDFSYENETNEDAFLLTRFVRRTANVTCDGSSRIFVNCQSRVALPIPGKVSSPSRRGKKCDCAQSWIKVDMQITNSVVHDTIKGSMLFHWPSLFARWFTLYLVSEVGLCQLPDRICLTNVIPMPSLETRLLGRGSNVMVCSQGS